MFFLIHGTTDIQVKYSSKQFKQVLHFLSLKGTATGLCHVL